MSLSNKEKAVAVLRSIETGSMDPMTKYVNPNKYIQHNLAAPDGFHPEVMEDIASMLRGSARVNCVRVFEDGNHVFVHSEYDFFGPKIGFDVFRFEDGLIVEHWDNLQETPASANRSGHTMIDGETRIVDRERTESNKARIRDFWETVVLGGNMLCLPAYMDSDRVVMHNPFMADGLANALKAIEESGNRMAVGPAKLVLGEGNFVLVAAEGELNGQAATYYDLFRLDGGRIVERWDVVEPLLPRNLWRNANGKF